MATGAVATRAAAPDPDSGLGTGTGEEVRICCKRRLGCSAFRGLNLRERADEKEEDTKATFAEPSVDACCHGNTTASPALLSRVLYTQFLDPHAMSTNVRQRIERESGLKCATKQLLQYPLSNVCPLRIHCSLAIMERGILPSAALSQVSHFSPDVFFFCFVFPCPPGG